MAYFMRNDSPDFFQRGLNTLEKVTRQYHMHEIYAAAAPIYSNMKENLPLGTELCACVNNIRGNGILVEMANIARQLRDSQLREFTKILTLQHPALFQHLLLACFLTKLLRFMNISVLSECR